jgi:nucleotide-binding universal stress UspA family protein
MAVAVGVEHCSIALAGTKGDGMYRKIVVGFRNTEQGRDALELGRILAGASGATMLIASISAPDGSGRVELSPGAERLAAFASAHLNEPDITIEARCPKASSPAAGLAWLAQSEDAELIVLGSTHRGALGRVFPGATAERLLAHSSCSVAVAPSGFGGAQHAEPGWRPLSEPAEDPGVRVIGVGYDGSAESDAALWAAAELALRNRAALRVFAVAPAHSTAGTAGVQAAAVLGGLELREMLERVVSEFPAEARAEAVYLRGSPAAELIGAAEKGVDLLVLGSRGGGPLRRAVLGSVSSRVMQGASCPVLISPRSTSSRHAVAA